MANTLNASTIPRSYWDDSDSEDEGVAENMEWEFAHFPVVDTVRAIYEGPWPFHTHPVLDSTDADSDKTESDWGLNLPAGPPWHLQIVYPVYYNSDSDYDSATENRSYQRGFVNYYIDSRFCLDHGYSSQ